MSETVSFSIKWGKETLTLEKYAPTTGVKGLKTELSEKTGVPVDRMKIMAKSKGLWKGVLKDDVDMSSIDWKAIQSKGPVNLLLMGSAAQLSGPKQKTVFIEDLPPEEIAKVAEPSGLVNLGNTCYLNSVVQCLRAVPHFRKGLSAYTPQANGNSATANQSHAIFLTALRETYNNLDRQSSAFQPIPLVQATRMAFPQFAGTGPHGQPMQQDAEEFYSGLLTIGAAETNKQTIQTAFKTEDNEDGVSDEELMGASNLVDALFGLKMKETLTCDELTTAADGKDGEGKSEGDAPMEPAVTSYDLHRKLVCNIQGGSDATASANVNHISEGIQLSLSGKIEKNSETLGRNAIWTRTQRIARLPPIITVQFGRFYWKATPDSMDHTGVKCKVMKPVAFNNDLDVYDFCTPEIQKVLKVARDKAAAAEEDRINKKLKGEVEEDGDAKMETTQENDEEMDEDLKAALAMSVEEELPPIGPGLPKDFQGIYELFAVVTHKGRDADGGHYMAWVKADMGEKKSANKKIEKIADTDEDNEDWYVFDDDEVSPCKTEDVLKLKGGGDWHMSYLNFYRIKK